MTEIRQEMRQEMQLLERTQEYEPKYDLWPYTRAPGGLTLTWIDVSYLWCT